MKPTHPKQHHYVPRFYLERFVDGEGRVWAFDKSAGKVFTTSPSKLAREGGFYEAPAFGDEIDQTAMEGMLSELEAEASAIIVRWTAVAGHVPPGTAVIEPAEREVFSLYLATQAFRTPEMRVLLKQGLGDKHDVTNLQTFHVDMLAGTDIHEAAAAVSGFVWIIAWNDSGTPLLYL